MLFIFIFVGILRRTIGKSEFIGSQIMQKSSEPVIKGVMIGLELPENSDGSDDLQPPSRLASDVLVSETPLEV